MNYWLAFFFVCGVGWIGVQILTGVAILGLDHSVEKEKGAIQFWFVISVETFAFLVVLLVAFRNLELI